MIHIQDTYIQEDGITSIKLSSYGKGENEEFRVDIGYKFNSLCIEFKNDKEKALLFMDSLSEKVNKSEDDYIKGFKDGVEYALKLNSK